MSKLNIGDKAPEINAVDQNGNQINLNQPKYQKNLKIQQKKKIQKHSPNYYFL